MHEIETNEEIMARIEERTQTRRVPTEGFPVTVLNRYGKFFRYCSVDRANDAVRNYRAVRMKGREPAIKLTVTQSEFLYGPETERTPRKPVVRRVVDPHWTLVPDVALVWIRSCRTVGYFGTDGRWTVRNVADAYADGVGNLMKLREGKHTVYRIVSPYTPTLVFGEYAVRRDQREMNVHLARKILKQMRPGDPFERLKELAATTEFTYFPEPEETESRTELEANWIWSRVAYLRDPENGNPDTFDMVRVTVGIRRDCSDKKAFLEKHKTEIAETLLRRLECTRSYRKFGVPVCFLRLTGIVLRKAGVAEFTFELKELKNEAEDHVL